MVSANIPELRAWITLVIAVLGASVAYKSFLAGQNQRRLEITFRFLAYFKDSLTSDDLKRWEDVFHGASEPANPRAFEGTILDQTKWTVQDVGNVHEPAHSARRRQSKKPPLQPIPKIMHKCHILLLVSFCASGLCQAGNILMANFDESTGRQLPISTFSGPILTGWVVQLGTFSSADPGLLIEGLTSPAGLAALLSDFITFGSTTAIGTDFSGLYAADKSVPIMADSVLVGKSIYTMIGNAATLAASTDLRIVRHAEVFSADNPVFAAVADISSPTAVVVYGDPTWPGFATALGVSANSLGPPVPEPYSAALVLSGILICLQRRKN